MVIHLVQLLLASGADFEMKNDNGDSPLHIACGWGHTGVVKALLEKWRSCLTVTSAVWRDTTACRML